MQLALPSYRPDRRGNRLEDWTCERVGHEWFVLLRGSDEIVLHVLASCPGAQQVDRQSRHRRYWTHRIHLAGPPVPDVQELLRLLQRTLVLCVREGIDGAVALDFYQQPCPTDPERLEYTEVARLIRTIKSYGYAPKRDIQAAGVELCTRLCAVVTKHPWLRSVTRILPAPGHDPRVAPTSAGVRIGHTLHRDLGLGLITADTRRPFRRSAKAMTSEERAMLLDEFIVTENLSGCPVLIVDDVYHTGCTMAGLAKAAREAGASTVLGIVAVRNMRLS